MSHRIYFAGCITSTRDDVGIYYQMIEDLKRYGSVLTEFVGNKHVPEREAEITGRETPKEIHDDDVRMLKECDCVVAEVSQPSLGVGYELGRAVAMGKRILCLYRTRPDKQLSAMIRGANNGTDFIVKDYTEESEIAGIFETFFDSNDKS